MKNEPLKLQSTAKAAGSTSKRPYERPRILSRESLEAVAAVCAPAPAKGNPGVCPQGPISS
jgi:hypothetical protein